MPFLLVRRGSVDYDAYPGRFRGHGIDLLPLSPQGLLDVETAVPVLQAAGTDLIVSSPMARALQTATILSWRLDRLSFYAQPGPLTSLSEEQRELIGSLRLDVAGLCRIAPRA
jgi:hypothetical protein